MTTLHQHCDKVQSRNTCTKSWTRSVESNEAAEGGVVGYGGKDLEEPGSLVVKQPGHYSSLQPVDRHAMEVNYRQ